MKTFIVFSGVFVLVLLTAYNIWAEMDRVKERTSTADTYSFYKNGLAYTEIGSDYGKGNIIGMQPYLSTYDYSTASNFKSCLRKYFEALKKEHKITPRSIVVLPEYIGTWLVTANEKSEIYRQPSVDAAMTILVIANLYKFFVNYCNAPAADKRKYALFSMKAKQMCAIYETTFSQLAKEYNCVIAAGSIALPDVSINVDGHLEVTPNGKIYNTAVVFGPNGKIIPPIVKKVFPVDDEQIFSTCGNTDQKPIFSTRVSRMGLLICAGSLFPQAYQRIAGKVDFVMIPSLSGTDSIWHTRWTGYKSFTNSAEFADTTLYNKITEGDTWTRYSITSRASQSGIHNGLNVFFSGSLWDLKPEGKVLILQNDSLTVLAPTQKQGRIVNLYLP
ncbi:nitrilase-related carbon-nitrogen hydrolase [Ferruginibacter paludis]|uniref:nitrilase-related carbon-nitrogen hydrolase n=1 Tax=Ferruginibacter paludis TaxID=1310417 RepID=UPI0025B52EF7|nr:nitrilase-related carbon-nitrogen hydrolase [Ferruginibacter paludis]MDN3659196.1 nitrilase-related carbon-nitrogen hydrolase [Ferruginibacter paludis]